MKYCNLHIVLLFSTFLICAQQQLTAQQQTDSGYNAEIKNWRLQRIASLKSEKGWLNLTGLFWLHPGINSFGGSNQNEIVFEGKKVPKTAGYFEWKNNEVKLSVSKKAKATINGNSTQEAIIYNSNSNSNPVVSMGSLRFNVIARGDKLGIRLRDLESQKVKTFKGIDAYPADTSWRIKARMFPARPFETLRITNVLGQETDHKLAGTILFRYNDVSYALMAIEEEDQLFIVFADSTNGETTYPSGRFLYAPKPDGQGNTVLDFNKAQNPPCAFTPFATCPLPPKQNQLELAVTAGEKNVAH